jgi:hypothetical protein
VPQGGPPCAATAQHAHTHLHTITNYGLRADGGLPKWIKDGHALESGPTVAPEAGQFVATEPEAALTVSFEDMIRDVSPDMATPPRRDVLDARSAARFLGQVPEPRQGIPSGHVKGSTSLPFTDVLTPQGTFRPVEELRELFSRVGCDQFALESPPVVMCGSGVTACVVRLAFHLAFPHLPALPVYDGSWTEWSSRVVGPKLLQLSHELRTLSLALVGSPCAHFIIDLLALHARLRAHDFAAVKDFVALLHAERGILACMASSKDDQGKFEAIVCELHAKTLLPIGRKTLSQD